MNQDTNAGTQEAQQEKATQSKRSKSAGKNRPMLVTSSNDLANDSVVELTSDTTQPVKEVTSPTTVEDVAILLVGTHYLEYALQE
jgi:hypothetical protein